MNPPNPSRPNTSPCKPLIAFKIHIPSRIQKRPLNTIASTGISWNADLPFIMTHLTKSAHLATTFNHHIRRCLSPQLVPIEANTASDPIQLIQILTNAPIRDSSDKRTYLVWKITMWQPIEITVIARENNCLSATGCTAREGGLKTPSDQQGTVTLLQNGQMKQLLFNGEADSTHVSQPLQDFHERDILFIKKKEWRKWTGYFCCSLR